jgi:hypothetical protein
MSNTNDNAALPFGLKAHEYADLLPLAIGRSREEILESLKLGFDANHPIVLLNGLVLDGRNRLILGAEAGLKKEDIKFREFNPSTDGTCPLKFVQRENISRRQLSDGHLSLVAAKLTAILTAKIKDEQKKVSDQSAPPAGGKPKDPEASTPKKAAAPKAEKVPSHVAREQAAAQTGVSTDAVKKAQLISKYPDITKQLEAQAISIDAAYQEACRRRDADKAKKDANKIKEERKTALAGIAKDLGADHQLVKAATRGSILKEHKDLKAYNELPKAQKLTIAPLVIQNISIKDALKVTGKSPDLKSTLDDLVNWGLVQLAKSNKKTAELLLPAGTITFTPKKA